MQTRCDIANLIVTLRIPTDDATFNFNFNFFEDKLLSSLEAADFQVPNTKRRERATIDSTFQVLELSSKKLKRGGAHASTPITFEPACLALYEYTVPRLQELSAGIRNYIRSNVPLVVVGEYSCHAHRNVPTY